ncbi:helix-turn-helix domain-containing protein [Portibacter lacus]|uniref:helix-turn-helix domain-containing protein n=1 Tax=Portibacter lacus TaxID=1099794 RepID=UPI001F364099|nr:helix-turn-helix domain-containing protein [Portibacter lacus]
MDNYTILSIASFVVVVFSLFFSFFLFTVKSDNKLSNRILGTLLFLNAIEISSFFYHRFIDVPMVLEMFRIDLTIANQPLLYFYVLSLIYEDFKLSRKHLLHFIPYIISFVVLIPRFYGVDAAGKEAYFNNYLYNPETQFVITMSYVQSIVYKVLIFYVLAKARKITLENFSSFYANNIKWLFQLNIFSAIILLLVLFKTFSKFVVEDAESLNFIRIMVVILVLIFTCWLILKALYKPEIFRGIKTTQKPVNAILETENNPPRTEKVDEKIQSLEKFMLELKPFLNPNLTIQSLANKVDLPVTELSLLINHYIGKHFFDYVNEYRIKEAMKELKDPRNMKMTISEILYQVGFNSKSSFNTAFKKFTSMTPSEFRKSAD